jgi:uncharacterized protein YcbX
MSPIGRVDTLWRYPVKSMRGERVDELFISFSGAYGDRVFALQSPSADPGFPFRTGREQEDLLRYQPRFRFPAAAAKPPNLAQAEEIAPGINPLFADRDSFAVDVRTPDGNFIAIDDPALLSELNARLGENEEISLVYSHRSFTDCRPVSVFSLQTARQLAEELEMTIDERRFRANIYLDLESDRGFAEEEFIGKSIRVGDKAIISPVERDPRCKMITLDPETGEASPRILRHISQAHDGYAGLYAAVLVEGVVRQGDAVTLVDGS